jgi:hypothetical protein
MASANFVTVTGRIADTGDAIPKLKESSNVSLVSFLLSNDFLNNQYRTKGFGQADQQVADLGEHPSLLKFYVIIQSPLPQLPPTRILRA